MSDSDTPTEEAKSEESRSEGSLKGFIASTPVTVSSSTSSSPSSPILRVSTVVCANCGVRGVCAHLAEARERLAAEGLRTSPPDLYGAPVWGSNFENIVFRGVEAISSEDEDPDYVPSSQND